jgi:hypothetical protein
MHHTNPNFIAIVNETVESQNISVGTEPYSTFFSLAIDSGTRPVTLKDVSRPTQRANHGSHRTETANEKSHHLLTGCALQINEKHVNRAV